MGFRFFALAIGVAAIPAATASGLGCSVGGSATELLRSFESMASNVSVVSRQEPKNTYRVFAHNVYSNKTAQGGYLSEDTITQNIATLNDQLNGYGFTFTLSKEDIRYTQHDKFSAARSLYEHEEMVSTLRQGNFDDFNIFYLQRIWEENPRGVSLGWATHPNAKRPELDGIFLWSEAVTGQDTPSVLKVMRDGLPAAAPMTAAHEFGHWLGLFHTNAGFCDGDADPNFKGQLYINDTHLEKPPKRGPEEQVNSCDSDYGACDRTKPVMIHNYMSTRTCVRNEFTNGQVGKMRWWARMRVLFRDSSVRERPTLNVQCTPFRGNLTACISAKAQCEEQHKDDEKETTECIHAAAKAQEAGDGPAKPQNPDNNSPAKPQGPENNNPAESTSGPGSETMTPDMTGDITKGSVCKPFNGDEVSCGTAASKCAKDVGTADPTKFMQCMQDQAAQKVATTTPDKTGGITKNSVCKPFNGDEAACSTAASKCANEVGTADPAKFMRCMQDEATTASRNGQDKPAPVRKDPRVVENEHCSTVGGRENRYKVSEAECRKAFRSCVDQVRATKPDSKSFDDVTACVDAKFPSSV